MSILIDENTKVMVQGITGRDGSFHALAMRDAGTNVVGGVTPGKGGENVEGLPVFNTVKEARKATGADCTVIFVPARFATAAVREAADAEIPLIVCITEHIPINDTIENYHYIKEKGLTFIGPNCPGLISPGKCKVGIMPVKIHVPGNIGVISRSGTLAYEVVHNLSKNGMGQSTVVGIGGDPVAGSGFTDVLPLFENDPDTAGIVIIGEIGGEEEEKAAAYIKDHISKPVAAFISGRTAPPGKRMGHAGAIISGGKGSPESKIKALAAADVPVADSPEQIPGLLKERLQSQ
jgi:succinyl-CoA synthetase alpha subunit